MNPQQMDIQMDIQKDIAKGIQKKTRPTALDKSIKKAKVRPPSAVSVGKKGRTSSGRQTQMETVLDVRVRENGSALNRQGGLRIPRHFVPLGVDPYAQVDWSLRSSEISDVSGQTVFAMAEVEVPTSWSQLATDIAVSKYFRRAGVPGTGHETSVRQLVYRVAHTIRETAESQGGYFASAEDAESFEQELTHILLNQKGAFNSPVWFNCGLAQRYGIRGSGGNFAWDATAAAVRQVPDAYVHPQCSACFIQSVEDDLMKIFDLAKNEARIFKYGSGTGTNFSKLRGRQESLSSGGTSSGLMSFLEVLDRGAGATKSGGTTRRAAKMVCLDMDHPEIADFINWKMNEEKKVAALVAAGYSADFNGEAYHTVSGQNSNNSVRVPDEFMEAVNADRDWQTKARTDGRVIDNYRARDLWGQVAHAAWSCADPGVQFDTTIQKWHTCPNSDRINGSNPCSEYMFLDDSACNLSSLNLMKFLNEKGEFDVEGFRHAVRVLFIAQDILVDFSSYPTQKIAKNSHDYRPLGLGYANLGTMLMVKGLAYDSDEARAWAGAVTSLMHGEAYRMSALIAEAKGPFHGFAANREPMLRVMRQHAAANEAVAHRLLPQDLVEASKRVWGETVALGEQFGYRNAQATVLAPTGTIGLLMDCDTTGIEPDFALVKFKKLAGGGYFKIINQSVPRALKTLGYNEEQVRDIVEYAVGTLALEKTPHINRQSLLSKGLSNADVDKIEQVLRSAYNLEGAVAPWVLGTETMQRLGLNLGDFAAPGTSILEALGFTRNQIKEASQVACGRMTVEGAPHLKDEHLPIFDCANKCGESGQRFIQPMGHVRMMAAAQPFLSGAISKTVNLPHEAAVEDIQAIYHEAWKLGIKAVAIYRDGSKMSQPLNSRSDKEEEKTDLKYSEEDLQEAIRRALELAPRRKRKMPQKRHGFTVEARVGGHQVYLRTGEYDDGQLGEIFIDMHKEGATFRSLLNCFAISVSMGLQYGVPLSDYVEKFTFTRFEPQGLCSHPNIKNATSILDYIFRVVGMEYLGLTDFVHVKPAVEDLALNQSHLAENSIRDVLAVQGALSANLSDQETSLRNEQLNLPMEKAALPKKASGSGDPLDAQLSLMMGDAPFCNECGHTTVRNGSCYRCLNCGNSMGCS